MDHDKLQHLIETLFVCDKEHLGLRIVLGVAWQLPAVQGFSCTCTIHVHRPHFW